MSHFRQFLLSGFVLTLALVTFVSAAPQTPPTGTATQNGDTVAGEFYKVWWRGNTAKDYKVTYSSSGLTNITVVTIYLVTLGGDEEYEFCTRTDSPSDSYPNAEASGNCKWDAAHQSIPDGNYEARVTISGSQSLTLYTDIFTIKTPPAGGTCTALTNVTGGPSTAATWTPLSATLNRGGSQTFRVWVTPDSSYMLSDVIVDPSDGPPESRGPVPAVSVACPATPDPIRNYTITAVVRLKDTTCKIRPSKLYYLGGVVNPPNETSLTLGQTYEAKADANSNWMIKTFSVNGQAVPDAAGQDIKTKTITCVAPNGTPTDYTVDASFEPKTATCPVTGTVTGGHGTITPTTGTRDNRQAQTFTAEANTGYVIDTFTTSAGPVAWASGQGRKTSLAVTCAAPNAITAEVTFKPVTTCPLSTGTSPVVKVLSPTTPPAKSSNPTKADHIPSLLTGFRVKS